MYGDNARLTAEAVSRKLRVEPTAASEAGDRVGRRSTARRSESLWLISSASGIEDAVELGEQLGRLLSVLEPVAGALWELADAGYEANWYCCPCRPVTRTQAGEASGLAQWRTPGRPPATSPVDLTRPGPALNASGVTTTLDA